MATRYRCTCGAVGDQGEMVEHHLTVLAATDDMRTHQWQGGTEPEPVVQARAARGRREQTRRRLAAAAGVTVDELKEVIG